MSSVPLGGSARSDQTLMHRRRRSPASGLVLRPTTADPKQSEATGSTSPRIETELAGARLDHAAEIVAALERAVEAIRADVERHLAQRAAAVERELQERIGDAERERGDRVSKWLEVEGARAGARAAAKLDKHARRLAKENEKQRGAVERRIEQRLSARLDGEAERLARGAEKARAELERRLGSASESRLGDMVEQVRSDLAGELSAQVEALEGSAEQRAKEVERRRGQEIASHLSHEAELAETRLAREAEKARASAAKELEKHAQGLANDNKRQRNEIERRVGQALGAWLREELGRFAEQAEQARSQSEQRIVEAMDARLREEVAALRSDLERRLEAHAGALEESARTSLRAESELVQSEARQVLEQSETIGRQLSKLSKALHERRAQEVVGKRIRRESEKRVQIRTPIDINRATVEELRGLNLSLTQARRVISVRESLGGFSSLDELDGLPGFSKQLVRELKQHMKVRGGGGTRNRPEPGTARKRRFRRTDSSPDRVEK